MPTIYFRHFQDSDPVELLIQHEGDFLNDIDPVDYWVGTMRLYGYRLNFYRSRSELCRIKREMVDNLLENDSELWNIVYGIPRQYRLKVEKFKIFFNRQYDWFGVRRYNDRRRRRQSWGRGNRIKIPFPRAHNVKEIPELHLYEPYPAVPTMELTVYWTLRLEPVQCRRQIFFDFFDALLHRRNLPYLSRKQQKRQAKRRRRRSLQSPDLAQELSQALSTIVLPK